LYTWHKKYKIIVDGVILLDYCNKAIRFIILKEFKLVVLGIESSCDDTGLAVFDEDKGLMEHIVSSQKHIHANFGGVVPELASRDHVSKFIPLLNELLSKNQLSLKDIKLIAYTNGPGLMGPLLTGATFAKTLAWSLNIKSIEINHLEAHIFSPMITEKKLKPPFLSLLVSGGHTILSSINSKLQHKILGQTLDDSVGEVFDKVARNLGLNYPGGPEISKFSSKIEKTPFKFPRPMINSNDYNFSFSGLKTHVINQIKKLQLNDKVISEISLEFENSISDVLITKTLRAANENSIKNIVISGGVSANKRLRERFNNEKNNDIFIHFPNLSFSTDNGAMIAYLGNLKFKKGEYDNSLYVQPNPSLSL
tara:strand:- start:659 stop:1756 length:1098 start_codon:yes stop_codon:yes gene_type:complete